ncbi:MAG: hypothetical protein A3D31_03205 [Candidatus Fluviicola riflensis]|nr:MAG: hypothetical protein CHH17_11835 [Candidatus Fluviicola riflensis]OGS78993.1 MAG: hypothetical protein A3D31_03205 [Candidatus Fluviicola riflensis]OGS86015.1 MAG: hypothetical protein A3E30_10690 [Fluviicola sp. RIFCSPHIGHO2_12_FULL_43_24]OGS86424.1 MAG: hypothetical protein A2724_02660 [Fluviicola sp. RIFCSPHIGHO2_01_FULL_43_53]
MDIINNQVVNDFINSTEIRDLYFQKTVVFKENLETLLINSNVEFHLIEKRLKAITSLQNKLDQKVSNNSSTISILTSSELNNTREITDLSGIRVIVFFLEDVRSVVNLICMNYAIDERNSNFFLSSSEHDRFGYQSVHVIVEWESIKIEVQIRTVLQHAWAAISHKMDYKSEVKAPYQLKRKLSRLSGLVEIADNELKTEYSLKVMKEGKRLFHEPIDYSSLSAYFNKPNRFLWYIGNCEFSKMEKSEPYIISEKTFDLKGHFKDIIECCISLSLYKIIEFDRFLRENLLKFKKAIQLYLKYSQQNSIFFSIDQRLRFLFHLEMDSSEFQIICNRKGYHNNYSDLVVKIQEELSS